MSDQRKIDNFVIDTYRQCPRLHYWRIQRNLIHPSERKTAAEFGAAFHLGMDTYYGGDPTRGVGGMSKEAASLAMEKAVEYFQPFETEGDEKRTSVRLLVILDKYFTRFAHEPFNVVATEIGGVAELDSNWLYAGRLDLIVEWQAPRGIYIIDHKTTYDINSLIARPHNQLTGYIFMATEMWENVLGGMINGIGTYASDEVMDKTLPKVPSPKTGKPIYAMKAREFFLRIPTQRSMEELKEWKREVLWVLHQVEESLENGVWPKHAPDVCVKYKGRCGYLDLCNTDTDTAERMIEAGLYIVKPWEAYHDEVVMDNGEEE